MEHYKAVIADAHEEDRYLIDLSFQEISWEDDIKILDSSERLINYLKSLPDSNCYPSLIVLDYDLQPLNGAEVLFSIKRNEAFKHIPVVVYARNMAPLLEDKLLLMGANQCFTAGSYHQISDMARSVKKLVNCLSELPKHF